MSEIKSRKIGYNNNWLLFGSIVFVYLIIGFSSDHYIFRKDIYVRSISEQVTLQSIEAFWDLQEQYRWLGYFFTPLMVLLKVSFATICISIGAVLSNIEFKFKTIFKAGLLVLKQVYWPK